MKRFIKSLIFYTVLLCIIEATMRFMHLSPAAFALPSEILAHFPFFVVPSVHGSDILATAVRSLVAFAISVPLGVIIGLTAYKAMYVGSELRALVDFLRSIPGTSLVPVFFVIFGIGEISKVAAAVYGGSLTVAIAAIVGLKHITSERRYAVEGLYGRSSLPFWKFEFPEILPNLIVGFRTSISLCLVLVTVAEMFMGTSTGLGSVIMDSRYSGQIPTLYTAIFATGALGYLLNKLIGFLERFASTAYPRFQ